MGEIGEITITHTFMTENFKTETRNISQFNLSAWEKYGFSMAEIGKLIEYLHENSYNKLFLVSLDYQTVEIYSWSPKQNSTAVACNSVKSASKVELRKRSTFMAHYPSFCYGKPGKWGVCAQHNDETLVACSSSPEEEDNFEKFIYECYIKNKC